MSLVRICPNCSMKNEASEFFCKKPGCGTSLITVQPIPLANDTSASQASPPGAAAPTADREVSGRKCPNSNCQYSDNPDDETACLRCGSLLNPVPDTIDTAISGTTREPAFGLRFSFGDFPISGSLKIGRDPAFSPIAGQIQHLDTVSRRHAEVSLSSGRLTVVDYASTNRVFVNGQPIPPNTPKTLMPEDKVSFSSQLQAIVTSGAR